MKRTVLFFFLTAMSCIQSFILMANLSLANDTIAEITPQGLRFKTENNISVEREDLYISLKKVEVSYIFKNHANRDITAEVAFPVPPYFFGNLENGIYSHNPLNFPDFTVEVNNKQLTCKKDIRAVVDGKDHTALLQRMNISVEDFGKYDNPDKENDISGLSKENKKALADAGIISDDQYPLWTVEMKYHWTQTFPANSTVNVKHSYAPYFGEERFSFYQNQEAGGISPNIAEEMCLDRKTRKALEKKMIAKAEETKYVELYYAWVPYILTTANNWKKPIKDFHLTIERPEDAIVSLCFDHKLVKTGPTRFEAHIKDFIPEKDLKVYFIKNEGEGSFDRTNNY